MHKRTHTMEITSKVSVIIPVYNTEAYVEKAVNSIQNQTLKEIEIIIINDGSTDTSLSILEKLAGHDNRIRLYSQENQGLSCSRNNGKNYSTGEYIYFMDSDDYLEPETLEICYNQSKKNNLDFATFDAAILHCNNKIDINLKYQRKAYTDDQQIYEGQKLLNILLDNECYSPSACLSFIKKSFLENIHLNFYPKIIHEDQLFTCQLYLQAKRVMHIHQDFFKRRIREDSIMTQRFSMKNMSAYFIVTDELLKFAKQHPGTAQTIDKYLSQMLNAAVWLSWKMPLKDRLHIAEKCLLHYKKYVTAHHLLLLLFKSLLKKK